MDIFKENSQLREKMDVERARRTGTSEAGRARPRPIVKLEKIKEDILQKAKHQIQRYVRTLQKWFHN